MAQHFNIIIADTDGVLTRILPGTPEAELWQNLVPESIKGRLVMKSSKRTAQGDYRFFVDAAGRQVPWQACSALFH